MAEFPPPPPGFEIDPASIPPPPPGFQIQSNLSEQGQPDISMTRQAYDPSFAGTTSREFKGGIEDIGAGIKRMVTTTPGQGGPSLFGQIGLGGIQAGLGTLRALTSPLTGLGAAIGENVGEPVRAATQPYIGNTASAALGATLGSMANLASTALIPGQVIRRGQQAAQRVIPKLPGAQAAQADQLRNEFQSKLSNYLSGAESKEAAAKAAFENLDMSNRLPMKNTIRELNRLLEKEIETPSGAKETLELLEDVIKRGRGTLSPQQINEQMTQIGEMTGILKTQGRKPDRVFTPLFAALARDAETPVLRTVATTPRANAPVLGLPAPGEVYPVAGGRFEAGQMGRTVNLPPLNRQLALPGPGEPPTAYGGRFEAGRVPMTRQVQSPPTDRGEYIFDELGNIRPKVYTAPQTGEIPYSGVSQLQEGVRPVTSPSVLGRRQVALGDEGQLPFRDPVTGELRAKVLSEPYRPGDPTRKLNVTEESVRPITPQSATGRRQAVLSPEEAKSFRDPATGELVAPGTRQQFADISGQRVLDYRKAIRERKSYEDIGNAMDKLIRAKQGRPGGEEFAEMSGPRMLNWLKDRPKIVEGIPETAMDDLEKILVKLAELPVQPPPKGVMYGSGKILATMAGVGGALSMGGVNPHTAAAIAGGIGGVGAALRALLPSPIGRKAILGILESGPVDQKKINMINALARAYSESQ